MNYISLALIAELNKELETSGKTGRIHVCDSCGGQSFRIEAENSEKAYEIIESFFSKRKIQTFSSIEKKGSKKCLLFGTFLSFYQISRFTIRIRKFF